MNSKIIIFTLLVITLGMEAGEGSSHLNNDAQAESIWEPIPDHDPNYALRTMARRIWADPSSQPILDEHFQKEGSLDGLIDAEVKEGDNLKLEYKQLNAVTLFFAKMGFFFVELYAKSMARVKKLWHTYHTARNTN